MNARGEMIIKWILTTKHQVQSRSRENERTVVAEGSRLGKGKAGGAGMIEHTQTHRDLILILQTCC
jgi:hypothetical protein